MTDITIYTDGGCAPNPGPGGWAAVILSDETEDRLSGGEKDTTNNRMELQAVIQGLRACSVKYAKGPVSITVHTDSQYVKNGITTWINTWKRNGWKTAAKKPVKNMDLWQTLDNLNQALTIDWRWVKGHSGNHYNELCDQMVGEAREKYK
jgi:ribonuclease HI